ncbi:MAG: hypothetical protein ABEJ28_01160 [Salinigranum sp.]
MPTLAEVYGYEDERTSRRLYLVMALALVLAGAVVFAAGATRVISSALVGAGASTAIAHRAAVLAGALLPPALLGGVLVALDTTPSERAFGVAGAVLSLAGAVGFLLSSDGGAAFAFVAALYVAGILFVVIGIGRSVAKPLPSSERHEPTLPRASLVSDGRSRSARELGGRKRPSREGGNLPTDGGEAADDITPLLDGDGADDE